MDGLDFRIMGPFEVRRDGRLLAAGGGRRRSLLAALLASANEAVSVERLRELIWGEHPPSSAANLIQGYVSDWRTLLTPARGQRGSGGRLLSTPGGYVLRVDTDECDALRFTALTDRARNAIAAQQFDAAGMLLGQALELRRGTALSDFADGHFDAVIAAIENSWLAAVRMAAELELRAGRPERAFALLERPMAELPLREDLILLGMRALYQDGRQGDALGLFQRTREALAQELGVDPEPTLVRLHVRILRHDPLLRAAPTPPTPRPPLPTPLSTFVGREDDMAAVLAQLDSHRLVTLTGPGGSGKTRLAIEVARRLARPTEDTVAFVDAATLNDAELLWPAIAAALGHQLVSTIAPIDALTAQLASRPSTLVLDNFEQLTSAAPHLGQILSGATGLRVLVTSRSALGIPGEQLYRVAPLPVPGPEAVTLAAVLASPSVRMFVDRVGTVDPGFHADAADALPLAGICRRLDGLPLALELAAAWTRTLTLSGLLERLDRPLSLLVAEPATAWPDRHRAMRDVIAWSYAAVTEQQRGLLEHLSGFESGARLDALEATSELGADLLPALNGLIGANLVARVGPADTDRYRVLQTVRDYALEQHEARPADRASSRRRHARWCLDLAERTARAAGSAGGAALVARLAEEQAEIRAALAYLRELGDTEATLALSVDCLALWWDLGHIEEGYRTVSDALSDVGRETDSHLPAAGQLVAAFLAEAAGRPRDAVRHERAAIAHAHRGGAVLLELCGQASLGNTLSWLDWSGPAEEGLAILQSAAAGAERASTARQRWGWCNQRVVHVTADLAAIDVLRYRDPTRARALAISIRDASVRARDAHYIAFALRAYGFLNADIGRFEIADDVLNESLRQAVRSGSSRSQSRTLEELARLDWSRGDIERAGDLAVVATTMSRDAGHAINWARCAALLADVRTSLGDLAAAAELLDDAERAVARGYPELAMRTIQPRRARLARITGDYESAEHYLTTARALDTATGLTPERIVYLVESALAATGRRDTARAADVADRLQSTAARLQLALPAPETGYLLESSHQPRPDEVQNPVAR